MFVTLSEFREDLLPCKKCRQPPTMEASMPFFSNTAVQVDIFCTCLPKYSGVVFRTSDFEEDDTRSILLVYQARDAWNTLNSVAADAAEDVCIKE